ncbi:putative polypeptide N-acetylgalactosaminyltransferase 13 isoform X3 [Drosophila virilis]|uniref:putative polypeptide N-acetylgalactosaminyltransferase 13 isoform X3 n=1 Tax=Drosophila virilis TaxID=7244 RepID=UPI0013965183|nr:putative polypeptide N-acetylgalactosaminyltransferase 13 isoform X3 [Drosophila virilis]
MSGSLRRRLRCCLVCILAFLGLQFVVVLLRLGVFDEFASSQLILQQQQLSWQFIAHTPDQPDDFFQYNRQLSDNLPAVRALPATRHDSCNARHYALPHASAAQLSVVISFYNEARSMLLRTILTLVSRTPEDYLHELIIIDDCSGDVTLLESLERVMTLVCATRRRPTLIFRRNLRRMGLIWSRNEGARVASGHYLLFLDSHCEVNNGWLEPLLDRLALNSMLAVSPVLDPIEPETLSYLAGNVLLKGGFDWSLHFHWLPRVLAVEELPEWPYSSPTFAGGILMISREWFHQLHGFNPHLEIWGGESIELAIKLWLCGGQIEIVPCSRIGHIFRVRHAFEFPPQFDEDQLDSTQATYLRLQHSNLSALGTLRNAGRCLYVAETKARLHLQFTSCHHLGVTQWHLHHDTGQLSTTQQLCLGVEFTVEQPQLRLETCRNCQAGQHWLRTDTHLQHAQTHLCLDNPLEDQLVLSACRPHAVSQSFQFALEMQVQA